MNFELLCLILIPLFGAVLNGLVLRSKNNLCSGSVAVSILGIDFILALYLFLSGAAQQVTRFSVPWFSIGAVNLTWGFVLDPLSAVMAVLVTGIGLLIHLYSMGYMSEEKNAYRFFSYLNLFIAAMLILVLSDNLLGMFIGWEGVGLCSYLLIGYWYSDLKNSNAGMKAFIINRIGDAGFLLGIFLCTVHFGTFQYEGIKELLATGSHWDLRDLNLITLCFFIGAMGKSAQIPLYVWLPDAMAGPTPVSALIHAATMVTSGVYMIARLSFLFQLTSSTNLLIAIIGSATALLAALIGTSQTDIKKVLAYSTVSQLGLMFMAMGSGAYFGGFFHVVTHAFFKGLLFLGAGSVIHALSGEQDIRKMGALRKKLPITSITFILGTLAISGVPPFSGFFSKDTLLYDVLISQQYGFAFWCIGIVVSTLTSFYMARLTALVFFGKARWSENVHPHESPWTMSVPLVLLAVGSVVVGWIGMPHGIHLLPNYFLTFVEKVIVVHENIGEGTLSELSAMGVATSCGLFALTYGFKTYSKIDATTFALPTFLKPLQILCVHKFYIDELYDLVWVKPFEYISEWLSSALDKKIIDGTVMGASRSVRVGALVLSVLQTGLVQNHLVWFVVGFLLVRWLVMG